MLARRETTVLDVRRADEWAAGHLAGSLNVFLADLPDRLVDLPVAPIAVHCASGYRANVAASFLHRAGREVVLVDDAWERAAGSGLATEPRG